MTESPRPPITCHVLDTHTGVPAADIPVTLTLISAGVPSPIIEALPKRFTAMTNEDGRVVNWRQSDEMSVPYPLLAVFQHLEGELIWQLKFEVGDYWKSKAVKPFFPEVEIKFALTGFKDRGEESAREHWHVPVLLGPYSYTTYRGS